MSFIAELILLLVFGIAGGFIVRQIKVPSIIGYILGGIIFSVFFGIQNSSSILDLSQMGITLLLFSLGIDFSLDRLLKLKKYALLGGSLQILFTIILSFFCFQIFGLTLYQSFFIGCIFSISSTVIVAKVLEEKGDSESFPNQIVSGWLVVHDIAVVLIVILLSSFANKDLNPMIFIEGIFKSIILILLALVVGRKVIPKILSTISRSAGRDLLIIVAFTFAIFFAFISEYFGVSSSLGAFLAGLMISESIYTHEIITEIKPFQTIFSMLFFITIGTFFSIKAFFINLFLILGLLLLGLLLKFIITLIINYFNNLNLKTNLIIALSISQIGEFAFLISQIGLRNSWISEDFYNLILSVTLLSMIISPLIINNSENIFDKIDKIFRKKSPLFYRKISGHGITESFDINELKNHVVICGYGKVGKYVSKGVEKMNEKFVVIELNDNEIDKNTPDNFIIGDASNRDILMAAKLEKAKTIIITMPKDSDINQIIRLCTEINPDIKIITRIHDKITEDNIDSIHSIIEPEYETAVKMVQTVSSIFNKRNKKINIK